MKAGKTGEDQYELWKSKERIITVWLRFWVSCLKGPTFPTGGKLLPGQRIMET